MIDLANNVGEGISMTETALNPRKLIEMIGVSAEQVKMFISSFVKDGIDLSAQFATELEGLVCGLFSVSWSMVKGPAEAAVWIVTELHKVAWDALLNIGNFLFEAVDSFDKSFDST